MKWLKRIHLVDRCLMLFMLLLMMQSAYNLFVNEAQSQETHNIDIIVRTSAAAIFGYFISANFIRHDITKSGMSTKTKKTSKSDENHQLGSNEDIKDQIKNQIGFAVTKENSKIDIGNVEMIPSERLEDMDETVEECSGYLQIIITSAIGIASLCILLIFRNFAEMTPAAVGTVSQLRDFVSGCVGFLIGCGTGGSQTPK